MRQQETQSLSNQDIIAEVDFSKSEAVLRSPAATTPVRNNSFFESYTPVSAENPHAFFTYVNRHQERIHYVSASFLGRGGYGSVNMYEATDLPATRDDGSSAFGQKLAVKEARCEFEKFAQTTARDMQFNRAVYPADTASRFYFHRQPVASESLLMQIMPFHAGYLLAAYLRQSSISVLEYLLLFLACAEALCYAHTQGFVHGDFKPDNVIVQEFSTTHCKVKLIDAGLSYQINETFPCFTRGRDFYPPERYAPGKTHFVGHPSQDVFSLCHFFMKYFQKVDGQNGNEDDIFDECLSFMRHGQSTNPGQRPAMEQIVTRLSSAIRSLQA